MLKNVYFLSISKLYKTNVQKYSIHIENQVLFQGYLLHIICEEEDDYQNETRLKIVQKVSKKLQHLMSKFKVHSQFTS